MRVTEKGQVTIPKEIRDRLKIGPGSEVDFVVSDDGVRLVRLDDSRQDYKSFEEWADSVKGTWDLGGMTTDEYIDWLRGPRDDLDRR
ncbi:AbrB/MazE/SpoVT family DNA-binding domain-containing protein [Neorhizobium sp. BETTINA12A]|uniref:AbrB/MazE/SpoVT family DNA-binding domain-containing protein n=1 Tax=unclassified Neorhizobium TaxID=2629175 RepID=UPI001FF6C3D7|nr:MULTISPECIES: AbrB/MazE/SpoVT family DNA-binding domain-containing protein [unclassified Neorhizobium]MCJ9673405.1 AbrB/MazE/SpoVT family DNA-binding domain-containing protein [Neorhizobium sp. SHOUNA12B]MCJ9743836.1 AbrB/MazE/SpoVT family DNA-binding domain-containing protein [Neorhizobium sp. SHOUNA12A]MCJ9753819.1 AbrB/MazE/SpoVT family DNA-binding domain-containing protein [Neorhizobium sp. BETTINA12A]